MFFKHLKILKPKPSCCRHPHKSRSGVNFSIYNFRIRSTTQIISIEIIVSLLLQCVKIRLLISSSSFFSSKIEPCSTNTTDRMAVELGYCKLNFNISSDFFFPPLSARSEWMEVRAISISENRTFTHHPTQTAFSRETQPDRPRFFFVHGPHSIPCGARWLNRQTTFCFLSHRLFWFAFSNPPSRQHNRSRSQEFKKKNRSVARSTVANGRAVASKCKQF